MANPRPERALPPHPLAQNGPGKAAAPPGDGKKLSSSVITLGAMGLLSTLVIGFCAAQDTFAERVTADCVDLSSGQSDGSYQVVDENNCDDDDDGGHGYYGSHGAYGWYYGGVRQAGRVLRGTTIRPASAHVDSRSGTVLQRGGFGGRGSGGS
ncbi:hypothetical protein [Sphaerisporangium perillae]|uniref:hypothetical protein n=1 Tax=Sphaerisporangium perillae TaxID=2935860 RepID=UPI00200FB9E2|nr:hypothetical protein [Sphaerisporangium perillae]